MSQESAEGKVSGSVDEHIANMDEAIALPRSNGELLFTAPWEARAFGLAVALNEAGVYPWGDFSRRLADEIARDEAQPGDAPQSGYYERWLATLESLVVGNGLVTSAEIEEMIAHQALLDDHDHDHDHDDGHDHTHHHHNGH